MEIKIVPGKVDTAVVIGSIDALTAAQVTATLSAQIQGGHTNLVLDFSQVDFMSSAGLRAILAAVKEARSAGGDLRLAAPQPPIEKILKMAGFHNILKIFSTAESALASF